jgi:hypothetical protein
MSGILQCLLSIGTFAIDIARDYQQIESQKDQQGQSKEQRECLY